MKKLLFALLIFPSLAFAQTKVLCPTPPMGWNSWNVFASDINEKIVMQIADAMVNTGMSKIGYEYINIDDYWHADMRAADGKPLVDSVKFPHGMKYLADYVHSKGLKLGIYSCAGNMTCGRRFGGYGYEEIDAKAYAEWGIDLLKYDYCYAPWSRKAAVERYTKMGTALKNSGRDIVFSVCEWGIRKPWLWAEKAGGSYWRTTPGYF
jgi:alpha-galactosidase